MAITRPCYCTREDVKEALDVKQTARSDRQIDRAIESASDTIDGGVGQIGGLLKRRFYPELRTMTFDWPNAQRARPWRLWLDANELVSVTTLTAGGTTITSTDYFLRPDDGPPYNRVEIDLGSSAAFSSGDTHQRAISINGVFGYRHDHVDVGTLTAAVSTTTETTVSVSDSSQLGVGDLIHIDYGGGALYEHMLITDKAMADTGVNIDAGDSLTASVADVSITMSTTTAAPEVGETILIDSERMLVVDVAGTVLTVKRAWDGSVLATHAAGSDIYAPRTLTVSRGAVGTTAATHLLSATVERILIPGAVRQLAVAEALNTLLQNQSGYARTVGSGENQREMYGRGLRELRQQVYTSHGRKARIRGV